MSQCSKCLYECDYVIGYTDLKDKFFLCPFCNRIFNKCLMYDFLRDDFGKFPIDAIERDMINARRKRMLKQDWKSLNV